MEQTGLRWVVGRVIDEYGNLLANALVMNHGPKGVTDSTYTDSSGRFTLTTRYPRLDLGARKVEDRTYCNVKGGVPPRTSLAAGDTIEVLLDARQGHFLRVGSVVSEPAGLPVEPLVLAPGESFTISLTFRLWVELGIPQADIHLVAGIEDKPHALHIIGTPGTYPGMTGEAEFTLTAPSGAGRYRVYLSLIPVSDTARAGLFLTYRQRAAWNTEYFLIPLGTVIVEAR